MRRFRKRCVWWFRRRDVGWGLRRGGFYVRLRDMRVQRLLYSERSARHVVTLHLVVAPSLAVYRTRSSSRWLVRATYWQLTVGPIK